MYHFLDSLYKKRSKVSLACSVLIFENIKLIYVQDAITVQKGLIKCTVAQKEQTRL